MELRPVLTLAAALAVVVFHIWASRRSPKYWYAGGIVPALWLGVLAFLGWRGRLSFPEDLRVAGFTTLVLLLIWAKGHQISKKRELEKMRAQDIR